MHASVHRILTPAAMGGIGKVPWPLINVDSALNFGGREDAALKFCPWVPGIASGRAGVSIDRELSVRLGKAAEPPQWR